MRLSNPIFVHHNFVGEGTFVFYMLTILTFSFTFLQQTKLTELVVSPSIQASRGALTAIWSSFVACKCNCEESSAANFWNWCEFEWFNKAWCSYTLRLEYQSLCCFWLYFKLSALVESTLKLTLAERLPGTVVSVILLILLWWRTFSGSDT